MRYRPQVIPGVGVRCKDDSEDILFAGHILGLLFYRKELYAFGGKKLKMFNVVFRRSYKDKDANWQNSDSFGINDIPKVRLAMDRSYEYLVMGKTSDEEPAEDF